MIYGKLKLVSQDLPKINFRPLNDLYSKQEGVPFNISIGGGTQGLCDVIYHDYRNLPEYMLPIEKYFAGGEIQFFDFLGIGVTATLILAIIIEIGCSILIMLGLFTRIAAVLLIFTMLVAAFGFHFSDGFKIMESSLLYLTVYALIWAFGPGDFSVDAMISKRRESRW